MQFKTLALACSPTALGDGETFKLLPSSAGHQAAFGNSISVSGTWAVVGAPLFYGISANEGRAWVFDLETGHQTLELIPIANQSSKDLFGASVSINGSLIAVGAPNWDGHGDDSGAVFVFDALTGQELLMLIPSDGATDDYFGGSVAISGTTLFVGAPGDDEQLNDSGSVYVFDVTTGA